MEPADHKTPIIMFDRYRIGIWGVAEDSTTEGDLRFRVNFIEPVPRDANLDSIPVFIIDQACLSGSCLDSLLCFPAQNGYEVSRTYIPQDERDLWEDFPRDLAHGDEYIFPSDYFTGTKRSFIPLRCKDDALTVTIHARLLDRLSGELIDSESKDVELIIRPDRRELYW